MRRGSSIVRSSAPRMLATLLLAMALTAVLAPAANAQIGDIGDAIGDITEPVAGGDDGSGAANGSENGTGSGSDTGGGGIVGIITDPITDGGSGGGGADPIDDITGTVDDSKDTAEETAGQAGGTAGDVGSGAGGTIGAITDEVDRVTNGLTGSSGHKNKKNHHGREGSTSPASRQSSTEVLGGSLADALQADRAAFAKTKAEDADYAATGDTSTQQSVITQISKIVQEAKDKLAFPALLTLLVVAFLMVQNRIDSRDPKLALAPVNSEHDLLSFT